MQLGVIQVTIKTAEDPFKDLGTNIVGNISDDEEEKIKNKEEEKKNKDEEEKKRKEEEEKMKEEKRVRLKMKY